METADIKASVDATRAQYMTMKEVCVCVCKICDCGRHHCTTQHTPLHRNGTKAWEMSEYTEKYPGYKNCQPPKSLKPKQEVKSKWERMEGTTTFMSDFIPYEVSRKPGRQRAEYRPNSGEIDLATTYKQEFGLHELQPVFPCRPKEKIQDAKGKLDTVPTYKEHFRQWDIGKWKPSKSKVCYHPPAEKFGNSTTFQDDFIPRDLVLRESFKPSNVPKLSDTPFEGVTSNQLHYIPHQVDVHFAKAPNQYKPSDQPFQDLTTHRRDYQGVPGQMPKSCKPEHISLSNAEPFQGSTEFRDRFQQWDASSIPQHMQKTSVYASPTEDMDLTTTTGTTFIKHHVEPFVSAKPLKKPVCSTVPFQSNTTMKEAFQAWKGQRQKVTRKASAIHRASGKMEDMTTFKAHYIQHQLQPNVSCKPLSAPLQNEIPLEEETTYRIEFTPKKVRVCPASFEAIPGFVFEKVDDNGHRFFRKLSSREQMSAECDMQTPHGEALEGQS